MSLPPEPNPVAPRPPAAVAPRPPPTEEEQREKLQGYVVVPKQHWPNISYNTHVRYTETSERGGVFRTGGFVLKNPFDTKVKGGPVEKRFIKLQNNFNKTTRDHKEWIVAYEDIEYLYVKAKAVELTLQSELQKIARTTASNNKKIMEYIRKIDERLKALERHQKNNIG